MEFRGTMGKWKTDTYTATNEREITIVCNTEYNSDRTDIHIRFSAIDETEKETNRANALLISRSPILFEEHKKEIDFLKRVKKQLDELGGSMEFEVEERIIFLEKLCFESVNLQNS
jgi:hypothetical protein